MKWTEGNDKEMDRIDWKVAKAMRKMKRKRERNMALRIVTKVTAVALVAGAAVMFSGAYNQPTKTVHDVYIVEEGDALWTLTEKYRSKDVRDPYIYEYMDEIKRLNPELTENHGKIQPGQILRFEYKVRYQ